MSCVAELDFCYAFFAAKRSTSFHRLKAVTIDSCLHIIAVVNSWPCVWGSRYLCYLMLSYPQIPVLYAEYPKYTNLYAQKGDYMKILFICIISNSANPRLHRFWEGKCYIFEVIMSSTNFTNEIKLVEFLLLFPPISIFIRKTT